MIGIEQCHAIWQWMFVTVPELKLKCLQSQRYQRGLMRHDAQRNNHRLLRQRREFGGQKAIAGSYLARQWLVLWRHTFHAVGNAAIG